MRYFTNFLSCKMRYFTNFRRPRCDVLLYLALWRTRCSYLAFKALPGFGNRSRRDAQKKGLLGHGKLKS